MLTGRTLTAVSTGLRWISGRCLDGAAWCAAVAWRRLPPMVLAASLAWPANAAPPAPGTEDYDILKPHGEWIRTLRANGMLCCDWSDTRPVKVRTVGDRWQIWLRPDQIIGAPVEQWLDVPDDAIIRGDNPVGMAIASWWGGRVRCFVPPGGI